MSNLKTTEKKILEDILEMGSGYVLDFNNVTFSDFFRHDFNIDIESPRYLENGTSKAKKLRAFWNIEPDLLVGRVLRGLLDYWELKYPVPNPLQEALYKKASNIVEKLIGIVAQPQSQTEDTQEDVFLKKQFDKLNIGQLGLEPNFSNVIKQRLDEAQKCYNANASLAVIFLCGSILEGILLNFACKNGQQFNQAKCSPKDKEGKVKKIPEWSLAELINAANEQGFIKLDVKKFSHELRDFRNYIHPHLQAYSQFYPTIHTAAISLQVLKAAIADLTKER